MGIFDKVRSITQEMSIKLDNAKVRRDIDKHEAELRNNPQSVFALQELSALYQEIGESTKAVEVLTRLAEIHVTGHAYDLALASYRKAERLAVHGQRLDVLRPLIQLYIQLKRFEEVYPYVRQALESLISQHRIDEAQTLLDEVPTFAAKEKEYRFELQGLILRGQEALAFAPPPTPLPLPPTLGGRGMGHEHSSPITIQMATPIDFSAALSTGPLTAPAPVAERPSWTKNKRKRVESASTEQFPHDTVLVVDDDPTTRQMFQALYRPLGCRVVTAADGVEGLTKALEIQPSLIISDLLMPNMDGSELFTQVREHAALRNIPFICVSSCREEEERSAALDLGVEEYWVKPLNTKEILIRTRRLLKRMRDMSSPSGSPILPAISTDLSGNLSVVAFGEVLHLIEQRKKSGILTLRTPTERHEALIYLRDGQVVEATCGALQGKKVIYKLLYWVTGQFEFHAAPVDLPDAIETPTSELFLEALRRFDASQRLLASLPDRSTVLIASQDFDELAAISSEAEFQTQVSTIRELFDGRRTLGECAAFFSGDVEMLTLIHSMIEQGLLVPMFFVSDI